MLSRDALVQHIMLSRHAIMLSRDALVQHIMLSRHAIMLSRDALVQMSSSTIEKIRHEVFYNDCHAGSATSALV